MEATRLGYDVYTAKVDDKGIDFVMPVGSSQPDRQRARRHCDSRAGRHERDGLQRADPEQGAVVGPQVKSMNGGR